MVTNHTPVGTLWSENDNETLCTDCKHEHTFGSACWTLLVFRLGRYAIEWGGRRGKNGMVTRLTAFILVHVRSLRDDDIGAALILGYEFTVTMDCWFWPMILGCPETVGFLFAMCCGQLSDLGWLVWGSPTQYEQLVNGCVNSGC